MAQTSADAALEYAQELVANGQLEPALEPLQVAVEGFEKDGEPFGLIIALKVLSETHRDLGQLDRALAAVSKAYEVFVRIKPEAEQVGDFATEIGSIYAQMGKLSESHRWYSEGLKEYKTHHRPADIAHNLLCLAGLARQSSTHDAAIALLQRARDALAPVSEEHGVQLCSVLLALSHSQLDAGAVQEAIASCQEATSIAQELHRPELLAESYQNLALAHAQANNVAQALESTEQALHIYETSGLHEQAEFAQLIQAKLKDNT